MSEVEWEILKVWTRSDLIPNVVTKVEYIARLGEYSYNAFAQIEGAPQPSEPAEEKAFVAYPELTPDLVLGWVFDVISRDDIEAYLRDKAAHDEPALPWALPDEPKDETDAA